MRYSAGILIISDSRSQGRAEDTCAPLMKRLLQEAGFNVVADRVIPDDYETILSKLVDWSDQKGLALILTSGGTGLSPRDVTPEATRAAIEREIPGIPEAIRIEGLKATPRAMLSRAVAGVRGRSLIINLPGSPKAVEESLGVILPVLEHAIKKILGDPTPCAR
ncbi:MogA/MoaB family molybdenum cofactor biosynthesis protein [Thermosulfuriphilus ammonigenes]|uniref:MogA/MoaB family molybdenum cofactor biosynthesis protein n=1 Tax=Thermosulfuriphilus ammonigenes TaxID=1936021 RepID=A0A6G7PYD4_9BACT|nr:MogA/MoaB family molybdenum cofactor biosynthesis protein [Thermosulfuriphilus ammonigenes]MBA2849463.1 molybdenum cofactor synthesis domain-containing protein [Thermosulfuriphilus ammonigenes]QIJ72531.1 MogA/MoaB family molybdenum cofactor biosynthesis protein [Thermosulfuriphilus ammonigenes]HFB83643.1 MogA/MoaB family molybdenum cofactor biosynthesis protein [Thermodesulfatator sp.]